LFVVPARGADPVQTIGGGDPRPNKFVNEANADAARKKASKVNSNTNFKTVSKP
jgi:hypothetical protein